MVYESSVEIAPVSYEGKSILRNLMELCQHDYSEFDGADVAEHGVLGYKYLDNYWTEEARQPFFMRVNGRLAGFALVRDIGDVHTMAEFFIVRKYRRLGLGRTVAHRLFDMLPGKWRVEQEPGNLPAQAFWLRIIGEYTHGRYEELAGDDHWDGPFQLFES